MGVRMVNYVSDTFGKMGWQTKRVTPSGVCTIMECQGEDGISTVYVVTRLPREGITDVPIIAKKMVGMRLVVQLYCLDILMGKATLCIPYIHKIENTPCRC